MGNNLRRLRNSKGWTQEAAAEALNLSKSGYIKLERGERKLDVTHIERAAEVYDVPQSHVLASPRTVQVVGYVGAGSLAHYYAAGDGNLDEAPMPEGGTDDTVALLTIGNSLGSLFNQWLVYYDEVRTPPTSDLIGKLCVVALVNDQILVKKLMRGSRPGFYHLLSQTEDPIEDAELLWAARVTNMAPR